MDKIRNKKPNIAVIGDLMIDEYIWGACERISPEAPVQVVSVKKESAVLGGAGNVLSNLVSLEAKVSLYSIIGDDSNASLLQELITELNLIHTTLVTESNRVTTKKSRVIASGQQVLRFDDETTDAIALDSQVKVFDALQKNLSSYDAILLSDYGKGVLTPNLCADIISHANALNIPILVDPKGLDYSKYKGATLLTPNKKEASLASNIDIKDDNSLSQALHFFKDSLVLKYALITLSEDGIGLLDSSIKNIPTVAREVFDVTGAGDTVLASLGVALASGLDIVTACEFANKAAAVVVAKVGSATATLNEVEEYEHSLNKGQAQSKIKDFTQIQRIAKRLKEQKRKIVFTNGCFDILHRGHASYLEKAKALGDILVLGLNSDESITRLKGETRPINTLEDRAFLLAALESVDYVVPFTEDTPLELIKKVLPDTLVKGADYAGKEVVGSDVTDDVVLIDFVEGKSTSNIIEKINAKEVC
jgi:D-beta-D-heptose 7-phosphate kinase/D-beta-D-heptose 1-phosphate adenosyltransferase